jgi:cold shock CspA family protein
MIWKPSPKQLEFMGGLRAGKRYILWGMRSNRMTGIVRSMPEGKQFGFIQVEGKDIFFHREEFLGDWKELVKNFKSKKPITVEFEKVESPKGPRAANVTLMEE